MISTPGTADRICRSLDLSLATKKGLRDKASNNFHVHAAHFVSMHLLKPESSGLHLLSSGPCQYKLLAERSEVVILFGERLAANNSAALQWPHLGSGAAEVAEDVKRDGDFFPSEHLHLDSEPFDFT